MFSRQIDFVLARFMRLAPWIEAEELRQEAALAALESAITYAKPKRHRKRASLETYQARAVRYALSHHVDRLRSPVSAGNGSLAQLRGLLAVPLQLGHDDSEEVTSLRGLPYVVPTPELDLDLAAARTRVRALLGASPKVRGVLLGEEKPAQAARRLHLHVSTVYGQARNFKRRLATQEELRALVAG